MRERISISPGSAKAAAIQDALNAGFIVDLEQSARLPTLDPRTWQRHAPAAHETGRQAPIAVAVDILDEEHSLRRAVLRLAEDARLRTSLGRAAREYWEMHHTTAHMVADYERVIAHAMALPLPQSALLPSLKPDPLADVERALNGFDALTSQRLGDLNAS